MVISKYWPRNCSCDLRRRSDPMMADPDTSAGDLVARLQMVLQLGNDTSDPDRHIPLSDVLQSPYMNPNITMTTLITPSASPRLLTIVLLAYCSVMLISLAGNGLVVHLVRVERRLHTVTNLFLVNLAASDLCLTLLAVPLNLARLLMSAWSLGAATCHLLNWLPMMCVYVSTYTMAVIAGDRYLVIVHPLRPRATRAVALILISATWLLATVLALPYAVFADVHQVSFLAVGQVSRCRLALPAPAATWERVLTVATFTVQFAFPITMTGAAYITIARRIWRRRLVGAATHGQQAAHLKTRRATLRMLVVIVVVFCLCWLPLNLYHLLTDLIPSPGKLLRYNSIAYLACHWLAASSACLNPAIYFLLNQPLRTQAWRRMAAAWSACASSCARLLNNQSNMNQNKSCSNSSPSTRSSDPENMAASGRRLPDAPLGAWRSRPSPYPSPKSGQRGSTKYKMHSIVDVW